MNDHGYVSLVVVIGEPSILCVMNDLGYVALRQMEHIHDHSLPHRILVSTMTTTNGTYP
jgi:hypothetical protein